MRISAERLRVLLDYDPKVGVFRWKTGRPGVAADSTAGYDHHAGYRMIKVDRVNYLAHRLAWLHFYGRWPNQIIDHINGIKSDNRIENLRLATAAQNQVNRRTNVNRTGYRGVYFDPCTGKFIARFNEGKKNHYLGSFSSVEAAAEAYFTFTRAIHGEFAGSLNECSR